jgi:NAD-dependent SIR2 family protein deacetylase
MGFGREVESFIENYLKPLEDGNAAIFAGAGLSVPSGYVDWRNLLRNLAKEIDLDVDKEHDLASLTQYFINERGRSGVDQLLTEVFCGDREPNENHRILSALPISTYWTTNYDDLIETSLRKLW